MKQGKDLVGGFIAEFGNDPDDPHSMIKVPCKPSEIAEMAKIRKFSEPYDYLRSSKNSLKTTSCGGEYL